MRIVHRTTAQLPDSAAITQKFLPLWFGVLVFDGKVVRVYDELATKLDKKHFTDHELKWMHKMRWLCGIDHDTGDLPHYDLAEAESRVELVMYFQKLKSLNYPLKAVVCDGSPEIPRAARFVFGEKIIIQRCTRHFLDDIRRIVASRQISEKEQTEIEKFILLMQRVIEADTMEEAGENMALLQKYSTRWKSSLKHEVLNLFTQTKKELLAHLLHPELNLPHTTNDIESLFKQLNLRLKSMGRFYRFQYAKDYLNAWALLRRFTPFTDCRGKRRYRNRKAPLELAGCEIRNIDPLKLCK